MKSPLITVFHIPIWRECSPWRRECCKLLYAVIIEKRTKCYNHWIR